MTNRNSQGAKFQVNMGLLITGAALVGVGSLIGVAGMVISGSAMADATRRWLAAKDVHPTDVARQQWAKARTAATAGAHAWKNGALEASGSR